jgi:hypothetical protein
MNESHVVSKNYWRDRVKPKLDMIRGWARKGLSDAQIALNLGIGTTTFGRFKAEYEELQDALREGREDAEVVVENALFKRAIGFKYKEVTKERCRVYDEDGRWNGEYEEVITKKVLKEQAPDVSAQMYWLSQRFPEKWNKNKVSKAETFDDGFLDALKGSIDETWHDERESKI